MKTGPPFFLVTVLWCKISRSHHYHINLLLSGMYPIFPICLTTNNFFLNLQAYLWRWNWKQVAMREIRGRDLGPNDCFLAHRYISFYFIHIFITNYFLLQLQVLLMKRGLEMGGDEENGPKRQLGCHLGLRYIFFFICFFFTNFFFYIYRLYFFNYNHHHPSLAWYASQRGVLCPPTTTTPPLAQNLSWRGVSCLPTTTTPPSLETRVGGVFLLPWYSNHNPHPPSLEAWDEGCSLPTSYYHHPSLAWNARRRGLPCPPTTTTPLPCSKCKLEVHFLPTNPPLLETRVGGVFLLPWSSNHNPHPPSLKAWDRGVFLAHHTHPFPLPRSKRETEGFSYLSSSYHICWWQKPAHTTPLLKTWVGGVFLCLQLGPKWQVAVVWAILSVLSY